MFNTENLLRNEVFPAELPPCFSTDDLAANATLAIATSNSFGQGYSIPLIVATSQNLHVENSPYQIHIIIVRPLILL